MEEAIKLIIDQLIRPRMQDLGWSENKLAKESGVSKSHLNYWLAGKGDITLSKFLKILQALNINITFKEKNEEDIIYRYKIEQDSDGWKCINTDVGFFVSWKPGQFDNAKVRWYNELPIDASELARLMRLMGEWLVLHHQEKL